jgi:hypothetical protein
MLRFVDQDGNEQGFVISHITSYEFNAARETLWIHSGGVVRILNGVTKGTMGWVRHALLGNGIYIFRQDEKFLYQFKETRQP